MPRRKHNRRPSHRNQRNSRRKPQRRPRNVHRSRRRKPSTFRKVNRFTRKYPVWTGVILLLAGIILFRLSFTNTFLSQPEVFMWAIILSIGLFIAGVLVLVAYWRNNVSMLTTRHNVNWRRR